MPPPLCTSRGTGCRAHGQTWKVCSSQLSPNILANAQWELSWVLFQKINHRAQRVKFLCFWRTRTHGMTFGKDSVISSSTHRHRICAWKHHRLFQVGESALPPVDIPVRSAPTGGDSGEQEGQAPACSLVNSLSETRASRTGQP